MDAVDDLQTLGIWFREGCVDTDAGVYEVVVAGPDEAGGRALLDERFGERVRVVWSAGGPLESRPRGFASWAGDLQLTAPLAARAVVDRVGNVPRPAWQELRGQPPAAEPAPRPSLLVELVQGLPAAEAIRSAEGPATRAAVAATDAAL